MIKRIQVCNFISRVYFKFMNLMQKRLNFFLGKSLIKFVPKLK